MSAEVLSSVAGVVLSLLLSYVPPFKTWWDKLEGDYKRVGILVLMAITALGTYGLACLGWLESLGGAVTCDQAGALGLLKAFVAAAITSQATYALSPRKHS